MFPDKRAVADWQIWDPPLSQFFGDNDNESESRWALTFVDLGCGSAFD
jgi:hypothetical protein